jgi:hypothetical protein
MVPALLMFAADARRALQRWPINQAPREGSGHDAAMHAAEQSPR